MEYPAPSTGAPIMSPQFCFKCGSLSQTPVVIVKDARPVVLCRECSEGAEGAMDAEELARSVRSGSICELCFGAMESPGGTTLWSIDGKRLFRVCFACRTMFP